ncbi:MAG: hypothetical protein IH889_01945 [Planctomycetes bacterium]|nr:hypothetical protein [Planctomycetota bacterium]
MILVPNWKQPVDRPCLRFKPGCHGGSDPAPLGGFALGPGAPGDLKFVPILRRIDLLAVPDILILTMCFKYANTTTTATTIITARG